MNRKCKFLLLVGAVVGVTHFCDVFIIARRFKVSGPSISLPVYSVPSNQSRNAARMCPSLDVAKQRARRGKFLYFEAHDPCLDLMVRTECYDGRPVPNIAHFVVFRSQKFLFHHMLAVLSAHRVLSVCYVLVHGDVLPAGRWWDHLLELVPRIVRVQRSPPAEIHHKPIKVIEHMADVARLRILREYGGIYMDTDLLALKSFNKLRENQIVLAKGTETRLQNAVVISSKDAEFLSLWYDSYKSFVDTKWGWNSVIVPFHLWKAYPHLVHIEPAEVFFGPKNVRDIFKKRFDWSRRYGIHLYYRYEKRQYDPESIKTANTTFGEVARFIYYGKKDLIGKAGG